MPRRRTAAVVATFAMFTLSILLAGPLTAQEKQPTAVPGSAELPKDPNNLYGKFDNDLSYIIRKNANPPGKVSLWLHVKTGALNETDQQNGIAHFLEHMAFNGSKNFKPDELIPLMSKLGMVFGADSNAHTNLWETVYKLTMPDNKPETTDLAYTILSDFASGLTLTDEEINSERGVILEESRSRKSVEERLFKLTMTTIFSDTRLAKHDVIGDEEQIKTFPRSEFLDYWDTWYRPENMTLIVVGDIDPDAMVKAAKEKLGTFKPRASSRQPLKSGLTPTQATKAFVLTDPEQVGGSVNMMRIAAGRPVITTVDHYRIEVLDNLSSWIVNRRYDELVRKGGAPFRDASVSGLDFINEVQLFQADAEGEPEDWNKMLDSMIAEVARAIDHGFTKGELELAKAGTLAGIEQAVKTESTRNNEQIVAMLSGAVGRERPIMSAQQRLDLIKQILDTVTVDELHRHFTDGYKSQNYYYVLTAPSGKEGFTLPNSDDIIAAARAAWAKKTEAPEETTLAGNILASEPAPGQIVSTDADKDLEITSVIFANGVVMHHKFTDYKKDQASISIMMPGGTIEENAGNKGVSEVAGLILARPATSRFTSSQVKDLLVGKNVSVRGGIGLDTMTLGVSGNPKDLAAGLQLAHALITDGVLEQSALDDWKKNQLQALEMKKTMPEAMMPEAFNRTLFGDDIRFSEMTAEQINKQERSPAEAWFKRIAGNAAIEVGVVGDINLEDAIDLVARYVGSLPKRTGDFASLNDLRKNKRGPGPHATVIHFKGVTPKAIVVAGFFTCGELDPERYPLKLAELILSDRMHEKIREKDRLVYSIGANHQPGRGMPGTGIMIAAAPTEPDKAQRLSDAIIEMMKDFADKGPSEDEVMTAKKQVANILQSQMQEPAFWSRQISDMTYRGRSLADVKRLPEIYQNLTTNQVQDAVKKYLADDATFSIIIAPENAPATQPADKEPADAGK